MSESASEAIALNSQLEILEPRPWVRYWARMFDIYLFSFIIGIATAIIFLALLETGSDALFGVLVLFMWVFVEAVLLCVWGTTPGKAFLKVKLKKSDGSPISINDALSRCFRVWWRGCGIGIPLVALITLSIGYNKLQSEGRTTWDRDGGFAVVHEKIGWLRVAGITMCFAAFLGLIILGIVEDT